MLTKIIDNSKYFQEKEPNVVRICNIINRGPLLTYLCDHRLGYSINRDLPRITSKIRRQSESRGILGTGSCKNWKPMGESEFPSYFFNLLEEYINWHEKSDYKTKTAFAT